MFYDVGAAVNRYQRIVGVIYCLAIAYCCVWIPWQVTESYGSHTTVYITYSLVWAAPNYEHKVGPAMQLIFLRLAASTAIGTAAFLLAGMKKQSGVGL